MSEQENFIRAAAFFSAAGHRLSGEMIHGKDGNGEEGSPHLVFLHEGLGSVGQWRDFPLSLCKRTGLPALVFDRWGYGKSEPCEESGEIGYLHEEALTSLPQVLGHFGIENAILIGHSDGGSIALIFAAAHPEKVCCLITEAAHVFAEDVTLEGIREAVGIYKDTDLRGRLAKYHGEKTDLVFKRWSETWLAPPFREWNIEAYLSAVSCPVLAIQGQDDPYGTPAQVEAIVRQVSGPVSGLIVPACGHIPHFQAREAVTAAMADFVGKCLKRNQ
ncbi:MAG: Alpha/beta hydrolase [Thermodesulfobacteriota bacterium]|nr:Alpha/beta hydrolase [Thermodesulfobacteriota bacterium]